MGWASGSELAASIIQRIYESVDDEVTRKCLYKTIIDEFENHDCDTMCECLGIDPLYDQLFNEMYPEE